MGRHGCEVAQGYYFSRPLPADECRALLLELAQRSSFTDTLRLRIARPPVTDPPPADVGNRKTPVGLNDELERRVLERTELETVHTELRDASHEAGMAEVATNVLHNVGNVLNSVNVSADLVAQQAQTQSASVSRLSASAV